jgi:predicted ribosomally synthesized peptide with SipW-like signal peptide
VHGKHAARRGRRWPLIGAAPLASVAALALLVTGTTLARYSGSETSGNNTLTAGTVTLTDTAIASCPITGLLPNAATSTCTFSATYTGNASAYLGLDVLIEAPTVTSTAALFNPADSAHDLIVKISSGSPAAVSSYALPGTGNSVTCPGGLPAGAACYQLTDDLVSTSVVTSSTGAITFTVAASLPTGSSNSYQSGTAAVVMTVHAVQSKNNALPGTCTSAGPSCPASGSFTWS